MKDVFGDFYHSGTSFEQQDFKEQASAVLQHFRNYCTDKKKDRVTRVSRHISQWTGVQKCMALVKKAERISGSQYDVVIKIRDNAVVLTKRTDINFRPRRGIKTKECSQWGGINDKAAIMAREYAELYMEGPLNFIRDMNLPSENVQHIQTPEQMLAASIPESLRIKASANAMPIVDGRETLGKQCIVPPRKDCYPTRPWESNVANMHTCPE